jgi:hypothetical protein
MLAQLDKASAQEAFTGNFYAASISGKKWR